MSPRPLEPAASSRNRLAARRGGIPAPETSRSHDRIYDAVRRIPRGRVATYGQVAELADLPRQPRQVGYALSALPDSAAIPWHRVVNAEGRISARAQPEFEGLQRVLLEREGVVFDAEDRVSLARFRWRPRSSSALSAPSATRRPGMAPHARGATRRTHGCCE